MIFEMTKEALRRAAYRVFLGRDPEDAILAAEAYGHFPEESEQILADLLQQVSQSDEAMYWQALNGRGSFAEGSWGFVETPDGDLAYVDLHDVGAVYRIADGTLSSDVGHFLRGKLEPGHVFLDAGAASGLHTVIAAKAVGGTGRVVAFDEDEAARGRIQKALSVNHVQDQVEITGDLKIAMDGSIPALDQIDILRIGPVGSEALLQASLRLVIGHYKPAIVTGVSRNDLRDTASLTPLGYIEAMTAMGYQSHLIDRDAPNGLRLAIHANLPFHLEYFPIVFLPTA